MNAKDISDIFNELDTSAYNETLLREKAQLLFLLIESSLLNAEEKEAALTQLRIRSRKAAKQDFFSFNYNSIELNSLLEELCLAADFYLLETGKRICLYPQEENAVVSLNLRAFENCFYRLIRELFEKDNTVSVYVKSSEHFCTLILRAESRAKLCFKEDSFNVFSLYENGQRQICLKIKKCACPVSSPSREDFSLLLGDRMSPLHLWLCDI